MKQRVILRLVWGLDIQYSNLKVSTNHGSRATSDENEWQINEQL